MEKKTKKHLALKIILALLPALIFTQNYAWMTLNAYLGIAFLLIWVLMVWSVWSFAEKNHILERLFRLIEISFFLLPLSAIIFSLVLGAKAVSSTSDEFAQAGAAIGVALGGGIAIVLAFIIGIICGIITHLIAGKYDKKAEASGFIEVENLSTKHGIVLSIVGVFLLAIIFGSISLSQEPVKTDDGDYLQQAKENQEVAQEPSKKIEKKEVELEIIEKNFYEADIMKGEFEDKILISFKFINKTEKNIKGVQGTVIFYDIFDNKILSNNIAYDKGIPSKGENVWKAEMEYNQFIDEHEKLRSTELENLKYKWEVEKVIYEDEI